MTQPAEQIEAALALARPALERIAAAGGYGLLVGGAVRDALLGRPNSDIDIEVYGLGPADLAAALSPLGSAHAVGRSFGVIKLQLADGVALDVALPQRRSRPVEGVRGTIATPDPTLTPREASARRDFTINALAITAEGELLDFWGGADDLRQGQLRHVSDSFGDDPLRVLRAVQFSARFGFQLDPRTAALCRSLLPQAQGIASERIWGEWQKWASARHPMAGLRTLDASGWLALYPELAALQGCQQPPEYHPEGDVWAHTCYVCESAASIAEREGLGDEARRTLVLAALCHDLGKPATTAHERGRIRSPGHAEAGVPLAEAMLARMGALAQVVAQVLPLVREHMSHFEQPRSRTVRRLAARLAPATMEQWAQLVEADRSGRPPLPPENPAAAFLAYARELAVAVAPPQPLLTGRALLAAGYAPGPALGTVLRAAYEAQLDERFATPEEALGWALATYPAER